MEESFVSCLETRVAPDLLALQLGRSPRGISVAVHFFIWRSARRRSFVRISKAWRGPSSVRPGRGGSGQGHWQRKGRRWPSRNCEERLSKSSAVQTRRDCRARVSTGFYRVGEGGDTAIRWPVGDEFCGLWISPAKLWIRDVQPRNRGLMVDEDEKVIRMAKAPGASAGEGVRTRGLLKWKRGLCAAKRSWLVQSEVSANPQ